MSQAQASEAHGSLEARKAQHEIAAAKAAQSKAGHAEEEARQKASEAAQAKVVALNKFQEAQRDIVRAQASESRAQQTQVDARKVVSGVEKAASRNVSVASRAEFAAHEEYQKAQQELEHVKTLEAQEAQSKAAVEDEREQAHREMTQAKQEAEQAMQSIDDAKATRARATQAEQVARQDAASAEAAASAKASEAARTKADAEKEQMQTKQEIVQAQTSDAEWKQGETRKAQQKIADAKAAEARAKLRGTHAQAAAEQAILDSWKMELLLACFGIAVLGLMLHLRSNNRRLEVQYAEEARVLKEQRAKHLGKLKSLTQPFIIAQGNVHDEAGPAAGA